MIIVIGVIFKKLFILEEKEFEGKGIYYCVVCDGVMYEGKMIVVVGGGNLVLEEVIFLIKFVKKVYIIRRYDYFKGE